MNPYKSPTFLEQSEVEIRVPSTHWNWIGPLVLLVFSAVGLLCVWFVGSFSLGGGYYNGSYGFFGYYVVESYQGVETAEWRLPNLFVSIAASLILAVCAYSSIRSLGRLVKNGASP